MNRILLFVNPGSDEDYARSVTFAADLVEAATYAPEQTPRQDVLLGIVAPARCCIEIGLSMLGRGDARTVEQGRRNQSPVRVFPFMVESDERDAETLREGLSYLRAAGAIEGDDRNLDAETLEQFRDADGALTTARGSARWEGVVVLGEEVNATTALRGLAGRDARPEIIRLVDADSVRREAENYLRPLAGDVREPDQMREVRLRAAVEALQFARLIDHLGLDPSDDGRR